MIDFPCSTCGRAFSVPDEEAGRDMQCPSCGILLAIPLQSDLASLNTDGTFRLSDAPPGEDPERLKVLQRAFGRSRVDDAGEEIDNRTLPETIELAPIESTVPAAPMYDPETGERIRAFGLQPKQEVPMAGVATGAESAAIRPISYRRRGSAADDVRRVPPGQVAVELFQPLNVLVMGCIWFAHFAMNIALITVTMGIFFLYIAPVIVIFIVVGHYANVLDEIGPDDRDELPRPLRSLNWHDDLWSPFCSGFLTLLFTWGPIIILGRLFANNVVASLLLYAITGGLLLLMPAVFLTLATSGSVKNLRPDRVLGVIRACGRGYATVALLGVAASLVYGFSVVGTLYSLVRWLGVEQFGDWGFLGWFPVTQGILLVGIYLMHLFTWRLALLYRQHFPAFPWVDMQTLRGDREPPKRLSPEERRALMEARQIELAARRANQLETAKTIAQVGARLRL